MKKITFLLIIIFCFFLSGSYYEEQVQIQLSSAEKNEFMDKIPEDAAEMLEKLGIDGLDVNKLSDVSFQDIADLIIESFYEKTKEPFKAILSITAAAVVCSAVSVLLDGNGSNFGIVSAVSSLSAASVFLSPVKNLISVSAETIGECSDFMLSFIPVYASSLAATGYVSSAAGYRTMMLGAVTAVSEISSEIIIPLILIYLAICISGSVSGIDTEELSKSVKSFAVWFLGITMTVFSGLMGISTLVSSGADGAFSKTAKFLIGSAVPVVGSTVSDAVAVVRGCLTITKNFLGIYAVLAIAAIFLPAISGILLWKICISVSSSITKIIGNKNLASLLSSVSAVLGIMLSLVVITGIMFIFSIAILLMTGGGI